MNIPNYRELKQRTAEAMAVAREPKKVISTFSALVILISLVMNLLTMYVDSRISGTGGLANMGIRSILATVQNILPLGQMVVLLCLELGYYSAVMRFARKQYADHTDLRTGFRYFGPLLRMSLLRAAIFMGILFASIYFGTTVYSLTPFASGLTEELNALLAAEVLDLETVYAVYRVLLPVFAVVLVIFAAGAIPVMYRYRMANYCLLDKPGQGALAAMRSSRMLMKGNAVAMFKVELHFWWYYALSALATVVCYGDQILPLLGVTLPMPEMASYYLFYGIYLAAQFAIYYFFRNRMEVTYAMVYEAIRPREETGGVVLGNIFDM